MGAYDCDCINNLEYDRRERKERERLAKSCSIHSEPRWVPVTVRSPEEDGFYLVTVNYGGVAWVHESYFMQCNSRGVHWDYPDVTAWMPMPEHYKGE